MYHTSHYITFGSDRCSLFSELILNAKKIVTSKEHYPTIPIQVNRSAELGPYVFENTVWSENRVHILSKMSVCLQLHFQFRY